MKFYLLAIAIVSFLIGCNSQPDFITTNKGLKYKEDKVGTGDACKKGDKVTIHFKAWVVSDSTDLFGDWNKDSTKFSQLVGDSKMGNGPAVFMLDSMSFAPGIDEVIEGMKPGGIKTVILPPFNDPHNPMGSQPSYKLVIELVEFKVITPAKMWDVDTTKTQTTGTGLKFIVVKEGEGKNAIAGDIVTVHFSGFLTNGNKFDSSVENEKPLEFKLGEKMVIPGWEEGIALMKKGGKARLIIPSELGFGQMERPGIPANSTLVFDVELIDINK